MFSCGVSAAGRILESFFFCFCAGGCGGVGVGVGVLVEVLLWKRELWRLRAPFLSALVSVEPFLSLALAGWFAELEWAELVVVGCMGTYMLLLPPKPVFPPPIA